MASPNNLKAMGELMQNAPSTFFCTAEYAGCNFDPFQSRATCDADARGCYAGEWAFANLCTGPLALPDLQCKVGGTGAAGEIDCNAQALVEAFKDLSNTNSISKTDWTGAYEHVFGSHDAQSAASMRDNVCQVVADAFGKALQAQNNNVV